MICSSTVMLYTLDYELTTGFLSHSILTVSLMRFFYGYIIIPQIHCRKWCSLVFSHLPSLLKFASFHMSSQKARKLLWTSWWCSLIEGVVDLGTKVITYVYWKQTLMALFRLIIIEHIKKDHSFCYVKFNFRFLPKRCRLCSIFHDQCIWLLANFLTESTRLSSRVFMTSSSCAVTNLEKLLLLSFYFLAKVKAHPHNVTSDPKIAKKEKLYKWI